MTEQEVVDYLVRREHMSRVKPTLIISNKRGSNASYYENKIRLSRTQHTDNHYARTALVIHEFAHLVVHRKNGHSKVLPHGKEFKRQEDRLLKLFGLSITRKKAYATAIYQDGVEVWHK